MQLISEPGVYDNIAPEIYHGQLTVTPSLGSGGAREIVKSCPRKFWHGSYLNPDHVPERKTTFDIGTAAHLIFLEPDQFAARTVIVDADDWRTKEARAEKERAYNAGKTPLLVHQAEMLHEMHAALMRNPIARKAFEDGKAEQTFVARDPETGVYLKARTDWRPNHGRWLIDYKTAAGAAQEEFSRAAWEQRYFMQDPWYRDVVEMACGVRPEQFWFVVQEKEPPYLCVVHTLDAIDIEQGRLLNRRAIYTFAECLATNTWPEYADKAVITSLPQWAKGRLLDMEAAGALEKPKPSEALRQAIAAWQSPAAISERAAS